MADSNSRSERDSAEVVLAPLPAESETSAQLTRVNERLASALAAAELGVWNTNFETGEVDWDD